MDEIAAEIGTSKSILYRYFTDKAGLQEAVGQAVLARLRTALEESGRSVREPRARIAAMVGVYLEMVEASPAVYTFVSRPESATASALRGFVADVELLIADAVLPVLRLRAPGERAGVARDEETRALAALWAAGIVGLVRGAADRWRAEAGGDPDGRGDPSAAIDRARLAEHITAWLWEGAAGVPSRAARPPAGTPHPPSATTRTEKP